MSSVSDFYRAFEDRHRGSRELIQGRQRVYLPFIQPLAALYPQAGVTDIGCGRGEWLELLRTEAIAAQGVDLDEGMLAACRELGLDVRHGDAIAHLRTLPGASQLAVTAFHLVEHLPFEVLQQMVAEALRVLVPGGLLVMETPNPENLVVGASNFYTDPTHEKPLPPLLLAFLPEYQGFGRVKTLRMNDAPAVREGATLSLIHVLAGVSPDYAVVAQKPGSPEAEAALDAAFSRDYGFSLNDLADRHEQQWLTRVQEARAMAQTARSENRQALERSAAIQQRLTDELMGAQGQLRAMQRSSSWRITRPWRWLGAQRHALREQGAGERVRRLARKGARVLARTAVRTLERFPPARRAAGALLRAAGMGDFSARMRARFGQSGLPAQPGTMTPAAERVHDALRHALAARGRATPATSQKET